MPETQLPVTLTLWFAALLPILVLLVLLVWRRWSTSAAAPVALIAALLVAILLFETEAQTLAVAAGKGIWDAIFILYVIWPALILYYVANEAGTFKAINRGLRRLIPDRLLTILTFAWVLSSFLQGIAGFGMPLAVTVPLMIGIGVKPLYAVVLPLLGRAWGNMFGSLAVTWFATLSVVDISDPQTTILYTTALLWIADLTAGLAIAWFYGRGWALKRGLPAILVISLLHGGIQMAVTPFLPAVGNFLAVTAALAAPLLLSRWSFYRQEDEDEPQRIFVDDSQAKEQASQDQESEGQGEISLWTALMPYLVLAALAIVVLLIPPVRDLLEQFSVGLPFPQTETGYGVAREATGAYAAFTPLTHPGTLLLLAALAGFLFYHAKGLYEAEETAPFVFSQAARDALPSTTAITALLLISKVMDHSDEITVLALGIAQIAPPVVLAALTPVIGILGSLITSSNTASNVLFAPLQATAAEAAGISVPLAIAGQSAGGATGNAIAPGDAIVGATIAGIESRLGEVLARALPWTLVTGLLVSIAVVAIHLLFASVR